MNLSKERQGKKRLAVQDYLVIQFEGWLKNNRCKLPKVIEKKGGKGKKKGRFRSRMCIVYVALVRLFGEYG